MYRLGYKYTAIYPYNPERVQNIVLLYILYPNGYNTLTFIIFIPFWV
jgi:hypothetical protein